MAVLFQLRFVNQGQVNYKLSANQGFHITIGLLVNIERVINVFYVNQLETTSVLIVKLEATSVFIYAHLGKYCTSA